MCWVRLKGPICHMFIIAVYMPHRGRVNPSQDDTLKDLETVLKKIPRGDCICLLGDFNEQLQHSVKGRTGKWTPGPPSKNAHKIMQLMQLHELTAANTLFEPRQNQDLFTFLQTKRNDKCEVVNDYGEFVGARVKAKFKGKWHGGRVNATLSHEGTQRWVVTFDDGYTSKYSRKQLSNILVRQTSEKTGKQLDYVLVSSRWKSCVANCCAKWGPSMHRDPHGEKNDHALVACTWKWRIRMSKRKQGKDYAKLFEQPYDKHGKPTANEYMIKFEKILEDTLTTLGYDEELNSTAEMYSHMCSAIHHAVDAVLPTKAKSRGIKRRVSEETKKLFDQRRKLRGKGTKMEFKSIQDKIVKNSLKDFVSWVDEWANVISKANGRGDTRKVYKAVKVLAQKQCTPPVNITTDKNGKLLTSAEEVAAAWESFLADKFAATKAEVEQRSWTPLPNTKGSDGLTDKQFEAALSKMSNNKACGPDNIPSEIYKSSQVCKRLLKALLKKIWVEEDVPVEFARATFVMLFKHKGSKDDQTKYRCIGLLGHAYKVLNNCLLQRLEQETGKYLSDWQAGFRKQRGCRDNVMVMRTLLDDMLDQGRRIFVTFIDYKAAFDSVSHKFLDEALQAAGASAKTRSLFRAIYNAASATTRVESTDGTTIMSKPFDINRGVIQGDMTSPIYFILASELILKRHDRNPDKGIKFGGQKVHTLGYADDAALLDDSCAVASDRVTSISAGSKRDADMIISIDKTEVMHVEEQSRVTPATAQEAAKVCTFTCPNAGCNKVFYNAHGCKCHAGKCKYKDHYELEKF